MHGMPGCYATHHNPKFTVFMQVEYSKNACVYAVYKINTKT